MIAPAVKWTPAQATPKPKLKNPLLSTNNTPRTLLNTPVPHQTPIRTNTPTLTPGTQQRAPQQTPVRNKPISKSPISQAQSVGRKCYAYRSILTYYLSYLSFSWQILITLNVPLHSRDVM